MSPYYLDDYHVFPLGLITLIAGPILLIAAWMAFGRYAKVMTDPWMRKVVRMVGVAGGAAMLVLGSAEALIVALHPVTLLVMASIAVFTFIGATVAAGLTFAVVLLAKGPASERSGGK